MTNLSCPLESSTNKWYQTGVAPLAPILSALDLRVSLGGRSVLEGVSLAVHPGEMLAVVGPNGAGKTTLLRCLAGILPFQAGAVLVEGQPVEKFARRELASILSYLPQESWTEFGIRVRDAVALGRFPYCGPFRPLRAEDRAAVRKAMERADVAHLADRPLPTLSGGERRRVHLARAIAQNARVLVLDEPTTALDVGHACSLMELLKELAEAGCAVVLSVHDLTFSVRGPNRAVLIHQGRVAATGVPAEVLTGDAARAAFGMNLVAVSDPPAIIPAQ